MAAQLAHAEELNQPGSVEPAAPQYVSFNQLPLFSASATPQNSVSSNLAAAWAQAIVIYWQANIANHAIDPTQPLYLLDMAPGEGEFAWLMLEALQKILQAQQLDLSFCYLDCHSDITEKNRHPYFRDYLVAGQYDLAYWDEHSGNLHLQQQNRVLQHCTNPLVVMGVNYFKTCVVDLAGVHNGKLQSIDAAIIGVDENSYKLDYQWATNTVVIPSQLDKLIAHYKYECNGCTLMLPTQACRRLDALNQFAQGRTLFLAIDAGVISTQQIRLGGLCPPAEWRKSHTVLPVNFHALGVYQKQYGANVWQQQLDDNGQVLHLAWCDAKNSIPTHVFTVLVEKLANAHPDDMHRHLAMSGHAMDTLKLLRLSQHDPKVLKLAINALLENPPALNTNLSHVWQTALVRTWCNYLPTRHYDPFYKQIGLMAAHLGHFGLAKECLRVGLAFYGDEASDLHLLAWCEAASGGLENAIALLARALAIAHEHPQCHALYLLLQKRLQHWQQDCWYLPHNHSNSENPLCLEPLDEEHAISFLHQYRDPHISVMTRLPELQTIEQIHNWIAEQHQEKNRACFAVMHECWGFVGLVSAHCAGNAGYFYFWIGSDFQGQGFGQQAAQLLFDSLAQRGVTEIFTSAYEDNLRSINALSRLGFGQLPFRAQSPDHELIFFHRNQYLFTDDTSIHYEASRIALCNLCNAIQSPLVF